MTTPTTTTDRTVNTAPTARVVSFNFSQRPGPRERDFGVGYGKSSGYASERRYTTAPTGLRFRVA